MLKYDPGRFLTRVKIQRGVMTRVLNYTAKKAPESKFNAELGPAQLPEFFILMSFKTAKISRQERKTSERIAKANILAVR